MLKDILKNVLIGMRYALVLYLGNLILRAIRKELAGRKDQSGDQLKISSKVDETSEESFPASDAPAWSGSGTTAGSMH